MAAELATLVKRIVPASGHHLPHRLERLRRHGSATNLHAERRDQLRLHRVREHGYDTAALRAFERRGQRTVPRQLSLAEGHLLVAFNAEEFHSWATKRFQVSGVGCQGMRASTGVAYSCASSSPADPFNSPPTMFSTMPRSCEPRSTAARMARRTASRDSGVGIVTVSTGGGLPRMSHSSM